MRFPEPIELREGKKGDGGLVSMTRFDVVELLFAFNRSPPHCPNRHRAFRTGICGCRRGEHPTPVGNGAEG